MSVEWLTVIIAVASIVGNGVGLAVNWYFKASVSGIMETLGKHEVRLEGIDKDIGNLETRADGATTKESADKAGIWKAIRAIGERTAALVAVQEKNRRS